MKRNQIIIIIISILIIGGGVGAYFIIQSSSSKISIAPDYTLIDTNSNEFNITAFQPKTVVLDFMSVTCIPCKEMYPRLADILIDANLTGKIEVISVETDHFTTDQQLSDYALEHNMTWSVAKAPEGMMEEYGVVSLPTIIIIDGEGRITYANEGGASFDKLKEESIKAIAGEGEAVQITSYQGFIIGFAIIVAITSFFSPCAFPLLPGYFAHILGLKVTTKDEEEDEQTEEQKKKYSKYLLYPLIGLSGGIGILVSYLILGIIITATGSVILPYVVYVLPVIGGIFIIFGALMFTNFEISFSRILGGLRKQQIKMSGKEKDPTLLRLLGSTFIYGLGYGIASLGCNAPIFLGFSLQVASLETVLEMVFAYLAFALPIILLMVGVTLLIISSKDVIVQKMKSATKIIKIASGVIMIIVGIYLIIEFILGIV
ncbi:MAG: redoxin domain-containing protein [Candidatus Heimdallarchaeota archaeon]|nr:redoxin domain-containing protein [Candidatus Heimdallarchaeota archaeon]